jgi:hypothetical protein
MTCHLNPRKPGIVYAKLDSSTGDPLVSATFDYCVDAAKQRGYNITNAQEVLEWLHKNADIVGYPVR